MIGNSYNQLRFSSSMKIDYEQLKKVTRDLKSYKYSPFLIEIRDISKLNKADFVTLQKAWNVIDSTAKEENINGGMLELVKLAKKMFGIKD